MAQAPFLFATLLAIAACGDDPQSDSAASYLRSICSAECRMFERCGSFERRSLSGEMPTVESCERDCNERSDRARQSPSFEYDDCETEWNPSDYEACIDGFETLSCDDVASGKVRPEACTKTCPDTGSAQRGSGDRKSDAPLMAADDAEMLRFRARVPAQSQVRRGFARSTFGASTSCAW